MIGGSYLKSAIKYKLLIRSFSWDFRSSISTYFS